MRKVDKMQALYQLLRKLVLPSNASSGARIVIDGTQNGIFIYDASNNLVESIAAAPGTDPFGNHYTSGFGSYGIGSQTFGDLSGGNLVLGNIIGGTPDTANAGFLQALGRLFQLVTSIDPGLPTLTDPLRVTFTTGQTAQVTGSTNAPNITIAANDLASAADQYISGSVIKTSNSTAPETWQTPGFNTNWAASTTFNGQSPMVSLKFHKDAENNLMVYGCFAAGAVVPGSTVFVLPSAYRPVTLNSGSNFLLPCMRNSGGAVTFGSLRVDTSGNVVVAIANGLGIAANDQFFAEGKIPLGNIP